MPAWKANTLETMTKLTTIFRNQAFQKAVLITTAGMGVLGALSGAWQVAHGDILSAGGLLGGLIGIGIGYVGLRALRQRSLHCA